MRWVALQVVPTLNFQPERSLQLLEGLPTSSTTIQLDFPVISPILHDILCLSSSTSQATSACAITATQHSRSAPDRLVFNHLSTPSTSARQVNADPSITTVVDVAYSSSGAVSISCCCCCYLHRLSPHPCPLSPSPHQSPV